MAVSDKYEPRYRVLAEEFFKRCEDEQHLTREVVSRLMMYLEELYNVWKNEWHNSIAEMVSIEYLHTIKEQAFNDGHKQGYHRAMEDNDAMDDGCTCGEDPHLPSCEITQAIIDQEEDEEYACPQCGRIVDDRSTQPPPWEYMVQTANARLSQETMLNALGSRGWELVCTTPAEHCSTNFLFKRRA